MSPLAAYHRALAAGEVEADPGQVRAVEALQRVFDELLDSGASPEPGWFERLKNLVQPSAPPSVPGLYLWGGVGRGKTWLMDRFFAALPFSEKRREHFHTFMRRIHAGAGNPPGGAGRAQARSVPGAYPRAGRRRKF